MQATAASVATDTLSNPIRTAIASAERRTQPRVGAELLGFAADASLSRGVQARLLNVSPGGALVEVDEWLRPGTGSSLKLARAGDPAGAPTVSLEGEVARCWVVRLAPLRYQAAITFREQVVDLPAEGAELVGDLERSA